MSRIPVAIIPVFRLADRRAFRRSFALLGLACLTLGISAEALELKSGKRVSYSEGTFLDDDLVATGASCRLAGTINGDVLALGQEVRNTGIISGVFIAGGNGVTHTGEVKHSLVAFGRSVFLDGTVDGTSYAFGETIEIGSEANLRRALYATCEYFVLDGEIGADAKITCKTAVISGVVGGDLEIEAEEVDIRETATINGDLIVYCEEQDLFVDDDALIGGEIVRRDPKGGQGGTFNESFLLFRFYFLAALMMIGLLLIVMSRRHVRRSALSISAQPLRSLAFGILTYAGGFMLVVALSVTFIGLPAAFMVFTALFSLSVFVGQVYLATSLGTLAGRKTDSLGGVIVSFLLGFAALGALLFVPYLGVLVYLLAGLVGAGGFIAGLKVKTEPPLSPSSETPPLSAA